MIVDINKTSTSEMYDFLINHGYSDNYLNDITRSEMVKLIRKKNAKILGVEPIIKDRLEYLRQEIRAERISQSEILELQSLADHIEPGDNLLLEWAGVPEGSR